MGKIIAKKVGMTGFEPATPRPPAVCANRTTPHPVLKFYSKVKTLSDGLKGVSINFPKLSSSSSLIFISPSSKPSM